ncbi:bifunctional adenosylcobinamide kinase/adenosylcobinamide-phosphate guanylyltransferase [Ktedonosporobacter rubrisoli]|uniref:Adenosylcobinamide kinase n=1 Tax=Ktedonosporobacter rubrisoli TaxID=2509675 RepID=A0A4P6JTF5_KTERU|nr:bifunctional adenosylcobinamide kinase/adenosylcobinamide-phosphate guanylyltransferase [Ktedonosporobacter rubrisoli]QBD78848.1 bifunctional adenosylcobinamide kinase/adenosylcobinamide-phosphate guanylyltransferase [Ktedonosporobacter rubrisoli]
MSRKQEHIEASAQSAPQLILVLGGARSGKSNFAEQLADRSGSKVAFIATATAGDEEMRDRIARHQAARPQGWQTIEEPLELARAVQQAASIADVIVLDCMTLWLSNWLASRDGADFDEVPGPHEEHRRDAGQEIEALLHTFASQEPQKTLIVVSNEVGLGLVPSYALGRLYRDVLGRINQQLAAAASRVYLMVAGLGVDVKRLHEEAML